MDDAKKGHRVSSTRHPVNIFNLKQKLKMSKNMIRLRLDGVKEIKTDSKNGATWVICDSFKMKQIIEAALEIREKEEQTQKRAIVFMDELQSRTGRIKCRDLMRKLRCPNRAHVDAIANNLGYEVYLNPGRTRPFSCYRKTVSE